ncbi:MAG TPA: molybdenum cofactor biosynthesis protein MoaE [Gemmatimonadales bacterium]|jgi:molybdopterin synthase catalytic subunit|nr:molybdenum cofactor biosynthesis protein MoaE [Gemmatimonadales bacterium]
MTHLTREPIAVAALLAAVQGDERGGTCVFLGTVRSDDHVTAIDYSAYDEMALAEITTLLGEAHARWPNARVTLQHRLGVIPVGEASIAIVAAAPHRDEAFAACRYLIEEVKQRLPIWKKELRADGSATWVGQPT